MNDKPRHILEQFPEKSHVIAHLIEEDPEFLTMCEDYDTCVNALRYWEQSKKPEAKTRVDEYRSLVRELEEEISQALVALKPRWLD
jgi:hypothetical protein